MQNLNMGYVLDTFTQSILINAILNFQPSCVKYTLS